MAQNRGQECLHVFRFECSALLSSLDRCNSAGTSCLAVLLRKLVFPKQFCIVTLGILTESGEGPCLRHCSGHFCAQVVRTVRVTSLPFARIGRSRCFPLYILFLENLTQKPFWRPWFLWLLLGAFLVSAVCLRGAPNHYFESAQNFETGFSVHSGGYHASPPLPNIKEEAFAEASVLAKARPRDI